jgi:hypothetical protein
MINISIDLSKIDASRIKTGKNGAKYYNITVDRKKTPDQYGNDHTVYNTPTKEERESKKDKVYLGSGKEFLFNNQKQDNTPLPAQNNVANGFGQIADTDQNLPF